MDWAGKEYIEKAPQWCSVDLRDGNQALIIPMSLDEKIENMLMASVKKMETGSYLALDPSSIQSIITASTGEINKIKDLVNVPIVLTSPVVRIYFKKLIDQFYPNVTVLSFSEIDNNIQIQALGNIVLT